MLKTGVLLSAVTEVLMPYLTNFQVFLQEASFKSQHYEVQSELRDGAALCQQRQSRMQLPLTSFPVCFKPFLREIKEEAEQAWAMFGANWSKTASSEWGTLWSLSFAEQGGLVMSVLRAQMSLGQFWRSWGQWHEAVFICVIKLSCLQNKVPKVSQFVGHVSDWPMHGSYRAVRKSNVCQEALTIQQIEFSALFSSLL